MTKRLGKKAEAEYHHQMLRSKYPLAFPPEMTKARVSERVRLALKKKK